MNILITGANKGLGFALTQWLLNADKKVIALVRQKGDLKNLQKENFNLKIVEMDFNQQAKLNHLREELLKQEINHLDCLINNAGYGQVGPLESVSLAEIDNQFHTNLAVPVVLTQILMPLLLKSSHPKVINISSSAGVIATPFNGIYAASKHALEAITEAMRFEFYSRGIQVTAIRFGRLNTHYGKNAYERQKKIKNSEHLPKFLKEKYQNFLTETKEGKGISLEQLKQSFLKIVHQKKLKRSYILDRYSQIIILIKYLLPYFLYEKLIVVKNGLKSK